jgi:bifunctional non-homologous end joining protein LigD
MASLDPYRSKRRFDRTSEPSGNRVPDTGGHRFVVQKHDARRLHYDFRLELNGVLKSWAVTRGPSLVAGEKRLAVHVEDHPLAYGAFEGTIPKGEYGGGTVIVWDRGDWRPMGDPNHGYEKGHLEFELDGEKLKGRWNLVRMAGKASEKRDNWLLIKAKDDAARPPDAPDILIQRPDSVIDDHSVLPDFIEPSLATLTKKPPEGEAWLHEIKFDGYRLQARIEAGKVRLSTRTGLDWTERFGPDIPATLAALPVKTALIDGELVVENGQGASDFSALQADLTAGRGDRFRFYVFDLLHLDGKNLRDLPLSERKASLQKLIPENQALVKFSADFDEAGAMILRHACRLGLEGVVSKRRTAKYRSGRHKDWLKSKCALRQEFVIAGYVPSSVSTQAVGSLVLGYYESNKLILAGRVGTGFSEIVAGELYRRLKAEARDSSPFEVPLSSAEAHGVQFVNPTLVAEVEFRSWTADHHLRHAAFRGLREDKPATEIVRETEPDTRAKPPAPASVAITHPDRIYWPSLGITKAGLADYYAAVWRQIAPFIVGRPLSVLRGPGGIAEPCFFQKHGWKGMSRSIKTLPDPAHPDEQPLLMIDDFDGLIGLVQGGVLELHPWGATAATLDQPDMVIFDLDPGPDIGWAAIVEGAQAVRSLLEERGLTPFVKTSGGKGLHVVVPLKPESDWSRVKPWTKSIAALLARGQPDRYVAATTKAKRQGKILIDYLRNGRGATAVAPYSPRARPSAGVSMPIAWDEIETIDSGDYFTLATALPRLDRLSDDPWANFREKAAALPESL